VEEEPAENVEPYTTQKTFPQKSRECATVVVADFINAQMRRLKPSKIGYEYIAKKRNL